MKVTQVAISPTEQSKNAGRPALTPELLAACGARYSRSNEGLETILSRIDPNNLDKSVDGIFKMIDYGHQSIADMAPVAIFIDGVSLYLAYLVWSLCPTAGGQESSTRYLDLGSTKTIEIEMPGEWRATMNRSYQNYAAALELWSRVAEVAPEATRIPKSLRDDDSERAKKQVARMERNYAFDRARYFLPVAAPTNFMLVMSARGWVTLCQHLLSHFLAEANALGEKLRDELALATPRLLKHAIARDSMKSGWARELKSWRVLANEWNDAHLRETAPDSAHAPHAFLEAFPPHGIGEKELAEDLDFHDNRYAWLGSGLQRTTVRFGWEAVALAEARDLNRHRTGTKWSPLVPRGFYAAREELPESQQKAGDETLRVLAQSGAQASRRALQLLRGGDPSFVYWTLLGTQYRFEHTTTADKFLYEAELRTGVGAHPRYAAHLRETLAIWYQKFPQTRGKVLEGSAEPE